MIELENLMIARDKTADKTYILEKLQNYGSLLQLLNLPITERSVGAKNLIDRVATKIDESCRCLARWLLERDEFTQWLL